MKRSILKPEVEPVTEQKAPEIKIEPVINVSAPAPDMQPMVDMLSKILDKPSPDINVIMQEREEEKEDEEKPKIVTVEVTERDARGFIKTLICTKA